MLLLPPVEIVRCLPHRGYAQFALRSQSDPLLLVFFSSILSHPFKQIHHLFKFIEMWGQYIFIVFFVLFFRVFFEENLSRIEKDHLGFLLGYMGVKIL